MEPENISKDNCQACGKKAVHRCSRCVKVRYCSKECQTSDWSCHKTNCKLKKKKEIESPGALESKSEVKGPCNECNSPATQKCANCKKIFYCRRLCQQKNWKEHKQNCHPFEIRKSDELGRYAIATRDIKAGEVLIKEEPLLLGPLEPSTTLCLGCYKSVDAKYRCKKCGWPLCGEGCESSENHKPECELTSPVKKAIEPLLKSKEAYKIIVPLRALYLKGDQKKLDKLMSFQSTDPSQKNDSKFLAMSNDVTKTLKKYMKQNSKIKGENLESFVRHVIGTIEINGFELEGRNAELMGLYPTCSIFEHSCIPNTKHTFNSSYNLIPKAAVDIAEGDHISTMYTKILWGTYARQQELTDNKYFVCHCRRCEDPTELGTNFSALKCADCAEDGYMLPKTPLELNSQWFCNKCPKTLSAKEADKIAKDVEDAVGKVISAPKEDTLESLINNCIASKVHPNHFHLFRARHLLLQLYGRTTGTFKEDTLRKKETMCQEFLDLCAIIDPGYGRLAPYIGVALYEYEDAVMIRVQKIASKEYHNTEQVEKGITFAKILLHKCINTLQDEREDQPGGILKAIVQRKLTEIGLLTAKDVSIK